MLSAINRQMLTTVAKGLGHLLKDMVFVGGAIPELYIAEGKQVAEVRQTDDVDCIIEIAGRKEYVVLEEELRALKFENEKKIICRWIYKGIIVDVMPTDERILGFTNPWYHQGIPHAITYPLENDLTIQILSLSYFMACKLEALFDRGMKDLRLSKDLEDIIFLVNYADHLKDEITLSEDTVKAFIQRQFRELMDKPELTEAVFCVLPVGENEPENVKEILARIQLIAGI